MGNVILEVKDLKVSFYKRRREGQAVRDVNFTLEEGQTLGIIGESGSGKSVSGMSVRACTKHRRQNPQRRNYLRGYRFA